MELVTAFARLSLCHLVFACVYVFVLAVDKTRNMEHSGTFRNIPEHPGTRKKKKERKEKKICLYFSLKKSVKKETVFNIT